MSKIALALIAATTAALDITIDCPRAKGTFKGNAILRTKPENKALLDRIDKGEFADDEAIVRELYQSFEGLPCESGQEFDFVLKGEASAYLTPAVIQAYYEQYGEGRVKNSKPSRGR